MPNPSLKDLAEKIVQLAQKVPVGSVNVAFADTAAFIREMENNDDGSQFVRILYDALRSDPQVTPEVRARFLDVVKVALLMRDPKVDDIAKAAGLDSAAALPADTQEIIDDIEEISGDWLEEGNALFPTIRKSVYHTLLAESVVKLAQHARIDGVSMQLPQPEEFIQAVAGAKDGREVLEALYRHLPSLEDKMRAKQRFLSVLGDLTEPGLNYESLDLNRIKDRLGLPDASGEWRLLIEKIVALAPGSSEPDVDYFAGFRKSVQELKHQEEFAVALVNLAAEHDLGIDDAQAASFLRVVEIARSGEEVVSALMDRLPRDQLPKKQEFLGDIVKVVGAVRDNRDISEDENSTLQELYEAGEEAPGLLDGVADRAQYLVETIEAIMRPRAEARTFIRSLLQLAAPYGLAVDASLEDGILNAPNGIEVLEQHMRLPGEAPGAPVTQALIDQKQAFFEAVREIVNGRPVANAQAQAQIDAAVVAWGAIHAPVQDIIRGQVGDTGNALLGSIPVPGIVASSGVFARLQQARDALANPQVPPLNIDIVVQVAEPLVQLGQAMGVIAPGAENNIRAVPPADAAGIVQAVERLLLDTATNQQRLAFFTLAGDVLDDIVSRSNLAIIPTPESRAAEIVSRNQHYYPDIPAAWNAVRPVVASLDNIIRNNPQGTLIIQQLVGNVIAVRDRYAPQANVPLPQNQPNNQNQQPIPQNNQNTPPNHNSRSNFMDQDAFKELVAFLLKAALMQRREQQQQPTDIHKVYRDSFVANMLALRLLRQYPNANYYELRQQLGELNPNQPLPPAQQQFVDAFLRSIQQGDDDESNETHASMLNRYGYYFDNMLQQNFGPYIPLLGARGPQADAPFDDPTLDGEVVANLAFWYARARGVAPEFMEHVSTQMIEPAIRRRIEEADLRVDNGHGVYVVRQAHRLTLEECRRVWNELQVQLDPSVLVQPQQQQPQPQLQPQPVVPGGQQPQQQPQPVVPGGQQPQQQQQQQPPQPGNGGPAPRVPQQRPQQPDDDSTAQRAPKKKHPWWQALLIGAAVAVGALAVLAIVGVLAFGAVYLLPALFFGGLAALVIFSWVGSSKKTEPAQERQSNQPNQNREHDRGPQKEHVNTVCNDIRNYLTLVSSDPSRTIEIADFARQMQAFNARLREATGSMSQGQIESFNAILLGMGHLIDQATNQHTYSFTPHSTGLTQANGVLSLNVSPQAHNTRAAQIQQQQQQQAPAQQQVQQPPQFAAWGPGPAYPGMFQMGQNGPVFVPNPQLPDPRGAEFNNELQRARGAIEAAPQNQKLQQAANLHQMFAARFQDSNQALFQQRQNQVDAVLRDAGFRIATDQAGNQRVEAIPVQERALDMGRPAANAGLQPAGGGAPVPGAPVAAAPIVPAPIVPAPIVPAAGAGAPPPPPPPVGRAV